MTDKCAPHPWVKAQNRPFKGETIKSILLLSVLCNLFAPRHIPDAHTKQTRNSSVIFTPFADQAEKNQIKSKHHNSVFLNTKTRDSQPYASPEGPGSTPSEKYHWWPCTGPLGAAMRLKALRQPEDVSKLMNPKPMKQPDLHNDPYSTNPCIRYTTLANTGKRVRLFCFVLVTTPFKTRSA